MKHLKNLKKITALSMSLIASMSAFASCGGGNGSNSDSSIVIDPSKTQVVVGYYDGGLGRDWLNAVIKKFEAINTDIQIVPRWDKKRYETDTLPANIHTYNEDVLLVDIVTQEYEDSNIYYDISDIVNTPLTEYGENESILDKMTPDMQKAMKSRDGKYYSLPYYEGSYNIYYDMRLFEEKALYMDGDGGWSDGSVKSAGKDGVIGTYDDGLPATFDEFFTLCNYMLEKGITPFTWTGVNGFYVSKMLESYWASYEGLEDFRLNYTLDSGDEEYTFKNGTSEVITRENAYKLRDGQAGQEEALEFANTILNGYNGQNGGGKYHSSNVWATGQTHMAAQDEFLFSSALGTPIGFIIEGTYWEREAAESFASLYKRTKNSEDKYGNRRFGLMPYPTAHGEQGKEHVIASITGSRVFINQHTDVPEEAKAFFRYLHTDEAMSLMTSLSQTFRPFDYTVKEEHKSNLTPLGKQIVEAFKAENAVGTLIPDICVDDCFRGTKWYGYCSLIGANTINDLQNGKTIASYLEGFKVDATEWSERVGAWVAAQK